MSEPVDVVLIGGGIMSATLGVLLRDLFPTQSITVFERGDEVAQPLMVEARQQSIVLARLIAALRIPDAEDNRPQRRGVRGAYGVQMRSVS